MFLSHLSTPPTHLPPRTDSLVFTWGGGSHTLAITPQVLAMYGHRHCRPQREAGIPQEAEALKVESNALRI